MAKFKKPDDLGFLFKPVVDTFQASNEPLQKDFKLNRALQSALQDAFNIFFWAQNDNDNIMKEQLEEGVNQIKFYSNKLVMGDDEKLKGWGEAFNDAVDAFTKFIVDNREVLVRWSGSEAATGAEAWYSSQSASSGSSAAAKPAEEEKKAEAPPKPAPAAAKPAPKAAGAKPPREPLKQKQGNKWIIENYTEGTISLTAEEVSIRVGVSIFNCSNCTIEVGGKLQSIDMTGCKKVKLSVDSVVSMVDVSSSQDIVITGTNQLQTVMTESVKKLTLHLTEKTRRCKVI